MSESVISALDLSPIPIEAAEDDEWLSELQRAFDDPSRLIVRLGDTSEPEDELEPVIYRDYYGEWWAGRYVGDIAFAGRRLEIRPRLGEPVISAWLGQALNLIAVPETANWLASESFIARLLALVWSRAVDLASRHGPPALRRDQRHEGEMLRGRLDVRGTIRLRARGSTHVASLSSRRSLDNEISRTIVAAEAVLTRYIGNTGWRPARLAKVLPLLWGAVGTRPVLPSERELQRVRYTPITRPFKTAAELSWKIAHGQGYAGDDAGRYSGLLLDIAELWELFVLNTTRQAVPRLTVEHSTFASTSDYLLTSVRDAERGMGQLKPDVLVRDEDRLVAVLDAKYKRLAYRPERRHGVDRSDLYQLASYVSRYDPEGEALGALLYPADPNQTDWAAAELRGPWKTKSGTRMWFRRLPLQPDAAARELADFLDKGDTGEADALSGEVSRRRYEQQ